MRVGMGLTRDQEIDYANERGIEIPITKASPYSIDVNMWGRSCETGVLEDPWVTPPADAYEWTVAPSDAPDPIEIVIEFEGGIPVALDGERLPAVELVERVHAHRWRSRRRSHRPRRGPARRHQEPRDLRDAGGHDPARRAPRPRGADAVARHAPIRPVRGRRAGTPHLRRAVVQRPVARPARIRGVVAARRVGRGARAARPRPGGGRRSALAAVAVRQEPRDVRRGRRVRPRVAPSGSSRSSGCRCGWRPPGTGRSASATAPPGHGPTRSSRTCRRRSPTRSRQPSQSDAGAALGQRASRRMRSLGAARRGDAPYASSAR